MMNDEFNRNDFDEIPQSSVEKQEENTPLTDDTADSVDSVQPEENTRESVEQTEKPEQSQPDSVPPQTNGGYYQTGAQTGVQGNYSPYSSYQPQSTPPQSTHYQQPYVYRPQNNLPPYQPQSVQSTHYQQPQNSPFQMNNQQQASWNTAEFGGKPDGEPPKPKKNKGLIVFSIVLAVALFATAGTFVWYAIDNRQPVAGESDTGNVNVSRPNLEINSRPAQNAETTEDGKLTDTAIAKKVKPSVVGIVAYVKGARQYQIYSEGSGIIMTKDGYIVTNAHVITVEQTGALVDRIQVYLDNDESYAGEIIGSDSRSDLAVIKIKADNLTPAEFGDSTTVEVGEHVLAIGNPSGMNLAGSVTGGMVSAVNRSIRSSASGFSMTCIQTDAAINPGNSGGALVNAYGQVIGINSSKIAQEEYEGIGFAIASSEAKPIIDSLMAKGYVEGRVKIGITYQEIDKFTAALNDIPMGLQVVSIDPALSVAKSGLQVGDIITKMDGQETSSTDQVTEFLRKKKPGETVKMTVYRITDIGRSDTLTVNVVLSEDRGQSVTQNNQNN